MKHFEHIKQNSIAENVSTMESFLVEGWDLAQGGHAKPRKISALLRPSVMRGSDMPPACHSPPARVQIPLPLRQKNKKDALGASFFCLSADYKKDIFRNLC